MPSQPPSRASGRDGDLTDRDRRVLAVLVREYIDRGEPVSSGWLAEHVGVRVSSATVRNLLSRLETAGYLYQPHTSAGRVPTDLAYRFYVDLLLQARRRRRPALQVEVRLRRAATVDEVLSDVSHELSRVSHHVGFALAPAAESMSLRRIDFVSLAPTKVLVIAIATGGQISQKVVELEEGISPAELTQASNYLNEEFAGLPLERIRTLVLERLQEERTLYDALLARALRLASSTLDEVGSQHTLFVHGAWSLLEEDSASEARVPLATLQALLAMIEEKDRLVHLLTEYIEGPGLTVVIGAEHTAPDLRPFSLVASTYTDGERSGTVGVLGPTRMRYSRTITAVDTVSRAVTRVLLGEET